MFKRLFFLFQIFIVSSFAYDLTKSETTENVMVAANSIVAQGTAKGELNPASNDVLFGLKLLEKAEALPDNKGWKVATDATCDSCRIGTQGFFGSAIEFDNEPDKLLIDSSAVNAFNGPAFSFSGWFRLGFGKGSVMKRNEFSLVEHGANKGWADSNLKSSVYEKSGFLEMKVYVRKKSDPEQWVLVIGKGISLSTVSSGQWIHCAFVANVDKLTIFMNGQSLRSVDNQPMLTNIGSARGKTNEKYSIAKNLYGAVDDAAIWSKALSEADVLAQAESINHYGKFVSLPMSVGNVLEGIKLTYSETPKDSVNAAISVDGGNVWINVENGVSLNPFWWQSMLSDKPEAQFRFLFSKSAAKVTDVEFELTANDETVPTVSNVKATPSAHGATITFDTDEIAFSQIEFEFDGTMLTRSPQESDARLTHEIQIDGALPNNKEIKFNIIVEDANKNKGSAHSGTFKTNDLCLTNGLELCGNKIDDDCNGLTDEEEVCYNQHDVLRSTLAEYPRHDNVEFNCNAWAAKPSTPERTLENFTRENDEFGEHNGTNTASCSGSSFTITGSVDKPSRVTVDLKIPPGPAFLLSLDTFQDFSGSRTYRVFYAFDTDDYQKEHVRPLEKRYYMNFYLITPPSGAKLVRLIVEGTGHIVYLNGAGTLALRREARRSRDLNADTPLNILFDWNAGDYRADDDRTTDPSNPLDVSMAQIKARALRAGKPLEGFNSRLLSGWGSASSAFTPPLRLGTTGPRDIVDALHKQAFACLWLSTNVTVEGENGNRGVNAETMCKAAVKSVMTIADWTDDDPRNGIAGFGRNEGGGSSASAGGVTTVLGNGEMLSGYAIAVDWMWPFLSAAQRRHAMSTLERETLYMLHRSTLNGKWTFETWWHWDPASNNWGAIAGSGMLLGGIVLQGFSPYADDMMKIGCWLDRISMSKLSPFVGFPDQLLEKPSDLPPTYNRADGVPYESHGYTSYPLTFAVPALIAYMRAGPNESETCLNPVSFQGGKMTNVATYFAYTTHAQRVGFTTFDDYYGAAHTGTMISTSWTLGLAGMLAAVGLEDKAAAHLEHWNRLYGSDKNTDWVWVSGGNPLQLVGTIMFYPGTAVKKQSFEELNFPLVRRFQYGRIVSRTGWSLNNDSVLTTQAGEFGAHTHYDQGSFFFTDFGLPLISEGRKSKETKVHSIVEIDDKNQDTSDGWTAYATSKLTTSARADVILMDYRQSWKLPLQQAYRVFVHLRKATPTCPSPLIVIDRLKLNDTSTHKFVSRIYADEQHSIESSTKGFVFKGENKPIREDILVKRNSDVDLDVLVSGAAKNGAALEIVANDKSEATFEFGFIARLQSTPNPSSCDTLQKIASSDSTVSLYSFNDDVTAIVNLDAHFDDALATARKLTDAVNSDAFVVVHNKKVNDIGTLIVMATSYTSSSGPVKAVTLDRRSSVAIDIKPSNDVAVQIRVGSDEDFVWKEGELKASISFDSSMVSLGDKVTVRIDGQRDVVTPVTDDGTIELISPDGDVHVFDVFTTTPPPITTTAAVTTRTAVAEKTTAPVYDTLTAVGGTTVDGTTPTVVAASLAVRDAVVSSLIVLICVVAPAMF